jgi:hypothetical protein
LDFVFFGQRSQAQATFLVLAKKARSIRRLIKIDASEPETQAKSTG